MTNLVRFPTKAHRCPRCKSLINGIPPRMFWRGFCDRDCRNDYIRAQEQVRGGNVEKAIRGVDMLVGPTRF